MKKVPEFPPLGKSGVQASLPPGLVPVGDNTLLFGMSISCAVFLTACQSVFQERLVHHLARVVPADTVKEVLSVGTIQILSVVSLQQIMTVIRTYSSAVTESLCVCYQDIVGTTGTDSNLIFGCHRSSPLVPIQLLYHVDIFAGM